MFELIHFLKKRVQTNIKINNGHMEFKVEK